MRNLALHDWFFWSGSFFLLGILLGTATNNFSYKIFYALIAAVLVAILLTIKEGHFNYLMIFILMGAVYFYFFDYWQKTPALIFDEKVKLESLVKKSDQTIDGQEVILNHPSIKIKTLRYPEFDYGDRLLVEGKIKKAESPYFSGIMYRPQIKLLEKNNHWTFYGKLFELRKKFQGNLKKVMPYNQAVFLSGLTVGGKSEFSKELREKFKASGTLHLVALSGYNISIIVTYLGGFFAWFMSRRKSLWLSILFIILFVMMAGAEASIVRAAIMGMILVVAEQSGRLFSIRNALVAAALAMILVNPKVLVFDLGFQLSFLAIIGIAYLKPILDRTLKKKFIGKKEILSTIAAETMVLPLLFLKLGQFTFAGIFSNPLIAYFLPLTMGLGFLTGAVGFISYYLSLPLAGLVNILLTYELAIINLTANYF